MRLAIRTDASIEIGTGHVMRCLTLADALQRQGAEVSFICRKHKGNLIQYIEEKGYVVYQLDVFLPEIDMLNKLEVNSISHTAWLGTSQKEDAVSCETILKNINIDWLIVDHYAIDYRWQNQLKKYYKKLMVIDDLADRKHDCDILIDQTFGRMKADYKNLVPEECDLLLGSEYAMLREEFYNLRVNALEHRKKYSSIHRVLVTLGGTDPDNVTETVLKGLNNSNLESDVIIDVLLGENSAHKESIDKFVNEMPLNATLSFSVKDVAERMLKADLAIGAGGITSWERCCLGLPTLIVINAANQEKIVSELDAYGAVINMGEYHNLTPDKVTFMINEILQYPKKLEVISKKSSEIVDGKGVEKIVHFMTVN